MSEDLYLTWDSDSQREQVYKSTVDNIEAYDGVQKASAYNRRSSYIDIEPNRSVRPSFNRGDYNAFRPGESVSSKQKNLIAQCMGAYSRVGIVRNVIDLMSDFAAQGLVLVHPNKSVEKFYRKWFREINGIDRSERFLNYLYRTSNVVVRRSTAKISKRQERELKKSLSADSKIEEVNFKAREIPWNYEFLNPLSIEVKGSPVIGKPEYYLKLSNNSYNSLMNNSKNQKALPPDIAARLKRGEREIPLDPSNTDFYFYKKDDWTIWADPMISSILDDIIMLEKMKLADIAALDGAISNVRLWTIGDLDHKIIPTKAVINKLRDILASNVGGGTMDMVWGPELKFTESQSQVYRFLGSEKYQPVLTSIYAGLGIPPTLTGAATGGGYTNNYVSLKTLIERLEYGRSILATFWRKELKIIQKAMGFRQPAEIHFDSIILSDEAAQKNLLIQLADRDIISNETLLERFREIPNIEKVRIQREGKERDSQEFLPEKASPYHNPQHKEEVIKLGITTDQLDTEEYFDKIGIPYSEPKPIDPSSPNKDKNVPNKKPGRPPFSKDTQKRKQKRVIPRSSGDESQKSLAILWAMEAQDFVSNTLSPIALSHFDKKNLRSLSKEETKQLDYLKLCVFSELEPFCELTEPLVKELLDENKTPSKSFTSLANSKKDYFVSFNKREPNTNELKLLYSVSLAETYSF